jgi:transposase InsO family protein
MWEEKANYPVTMMARLLKIARSGYYRWVKRKDAAPCAGAGRRAALKAEVKRVWLASHKRYGARRVHAELAAKGQAVSLWLVRKLMRELGIEGVQPRRSRRTTVPDPGAPKRLDLVGRDFNRPVPGTFLVGDITYLRTGQGWLYLATVIDLTTRMVVGWQMADHMRASLVCGALRMAHQAGRVAGNAVFHSDRGSVYTSAEFAGCAARLDVRLSVGRTGSCHDNAVAESWFSMLKNEMYDLRDFPTRARARAAVAEYIEVFYNRQRRHSTLGYRTPAQAMDDHLVAWPRDDDLPMAA